MDHRVIFLHVTQDFKSKSDLAVRKIFPVPSAFI